MSQATLSDMLSKDLHDQHFQAHSGAGGHYCLHWEGLWICRDCHEWKSCQCDLKEPED